MGERTAVLEFEEVRQEYAVKDARGIPMSVHERYRNALAEMRRQIRVARSGASGKKVGELLVEQGIIDRDGLQQALAEQQRRGRGELLGEVLEALGLVKEETLLAVLQMQLSEN